MKHGAVAAGTSSKRAQRSHVETAEAGVEMNVQRCIMGSAIELPAAKRLDNIADDGAATMRISK